MELKQKQLLDILKKKKHIIIWDEGDSKVGVRYAYQGFTVYEIPTVINFMMNQFMADKNKEMIEPPENEEEDKGKVDYVG